MATKVTVVDGSTRTGVYADDGSINVVIRDGSTRVGVYHPCGAFNIVVVADLGKGLYHPSGAYNAVLLPSGQYRFGVWSGIGLSTGGGSGFDPSIAAKGWNSASNAGTAGDYFVALSGSDSNPGSVGSPFLTVQKAVDAAIAAGGGKTIRVMGNGAKFRPPATAPGCLVDLKTASGLTIAGYGTDKPILTGAKVLTGWTLVTGADSAAVTALGSTLAGSGNVYKTTISASAFSYNGGNNADFFLYENDVYMPPAFARANLSNPFIQDDSSYLFSASAAFTTVPRGTTPETYSITAVTDTRFAAYTQAQMLQAKLFVFNNPNLVGRVNVTAFNAGTNTATVDRALEYAAGKDLYGISNIGPEMKQGQWCSVDNGDGYYTVYIWPTNVANLAAKIEFAALSVVIDINTATSTTISDLQIEHVSGDALSNYSGLIATHLNNSSPKTGLHITNCRARRASINRQGLIKLLAVSACEIDHVTFEDGQGSFGIDIAGVNAANLITGHKQHNNWASNLTQSAYRVFCADRPWLYYEGADNASLGAHANKANAYQGCVAPLFYGLDFRNTVDGYLTWQAASSVVVAMCTLPVGHDGRGLVDQNNGSGAPQPNTANYIYNVIAPPSPRQDPLITPQGNSATFTYNEGATYTLVNSVLNGASFAAGSKTEESHNVITYAKPGESGNYDATDNTSFIGSPEKVFESVAASDYRPCIGSPILTTTPRAMTDILAAVKALHPTFPHFDKDQNGRVWSAPFIGVDSAAVAVPDVTAPTLSSAAGTPTAYNVAGSVSTTEGRGTLYWVLTSGTSVPSSAQVIAGQNAAGTAAVSAGNKGVTAAGAQSVTATAAANGTHRLHFVQVDVAGNISAVASSASITIAAIDYRYAGFSRTSTNSNLNPTSNVYGGTTALGAGNAVDTNQVGSFSITGADAGKVAVATIHTYAISGTSVPTAVKIGGVAATLVVGTSGGSTSINGSCSMWVATLGGSPSATVEVTYGTTVHGVGASVSILDGVQATAAGSFEAKSASIGNSVSGTLTTPTNGILIAATWSLNASTNRTGAIQGDSGEAMDGRRVETYADAPDAIDGNNGFCLVYSRNTGVAHAGEQISGGTTNATTWHHLVAAAFGP